MGSTWSQANGRLMSTSVHRYTNNPRPGTLGRLEGLAWDQALEPLAVRLGRVFDLVSGEMADLDADLAAIQPVEGPVKSSASHLLRLPGKRLRPLCVALAARTAGDTPAGVKDIAVAAELIHSATLLHDDVVDLGDVRRGEQTARLVYGNAASVFAGDWLLVEAIRRVRRGAASHPDVLDAMLDAIDRMIGAESVQLEGRGRLVCERDVYLSVVRGKTGALFGWALYAGARVGGLPEAVCLALEGYGSHLGVAFQVVDDILDLRGDPTALGKSLHADLREGKATFPLIAALEARPSLRTAVESLSRGDGERAVGSAEDIVASIAAAGGFAAAEAFAREETAAALDCLTKVPGGAARDALVTLCEAVLRRAN
jgi:octaprenyl-diphosphate synthase